MKVEIEYVLREYGTTSRSLQNSTGKMVVVCG
jgi:hypothetical protein